MKRLYTLPANTRAVCRLRWQTVNSDPGARAAAGAKEDEEEEGASVWCQLQWPIQYLCAHWRHNSLLAGRPVCRLPAVFVTLLLIVTPYQLATASS